MTHNFALIEVPAPALLPLAFPLKTAQSAIANGNFVGFESMTVPQMEMEMKTIKEGNNPYVHQVPLGYQTGGNVTLRMAVFPLNIDMWTWWKQVVSGSFAPRRHMLLTHTRPDKGLPARMILCQRCIPVSWKPASDFNASTSEVSMEEITFYTENVEIIPVPISDIAPRTTATGGFL
jgi:phage tail-like protein